MIRQFARYYEGSISNQELLDAIIAYDFADYADTLRAIASLKDVCRRSCTSMTCHSNGSSGDALGRYPFGPDFEFWCPQVEKILRGHDVQVRISHGSRDSENCCFLRPIVVRRGNDYSIFLDLTSESNRRQMIDIIVSICNEHERLVSLCGKPNVWLLFCTDIRVRRDFLSCSPFVKSLVNEDWELCPHRLLKSSLFFNDQMIDWKTGVNFYTCRSGTKHFLPIFHVEGKRAVNLLNISLGPVPMSDEWEICGQRQMCSCGKPYFPFHFRSHVAHNLDVSREFISRLESGYTNLQILRQGSRTRVLYSCSTNEFKDEDLIRSVVGNAIFEEDRQFYIGRKKYNFWEDDRDVTVESWSKIFPETIKLN